MRVNIYSQELTSEVIHLEKGSEGLTYHAARLMLHSSAMLHHPPANDDDRSAVTFWLPKSQTRREEMARAFETIALIFRTAPESGSD